MALESSQSYILQKKKYQSSSSNMSSVFLSAHMRKIAKESVLNGRGDVSMLQNVLSVNLNHPI